MDTLKDHFSIYLFFSSNFAKNNYCFKHVTQLYFREMEIIAWNIKYPLYFKYQCISTIECRIFVSFIWSRSELWKCYNNNVFTKKLIFATYIGMSRLHQPYIEAKNSFLVPIFYYINYPTSMLEDPPKSEKRMSFFSLGHHSCNVTQTE